MPTWSLERVLDLLSSEGYSANLAVLDLHEALFLTALASGLRSQIVALFHGLFSPLLKRIYLQSL